MIPELGAVLRDLSRLWLPNHSKSWSWTQGSGQAAFSLSAWAQGTDGRRQGSSFLTHLSVQLTEAISAVRQQQQGAGWESQK